MKKIMRYAAGITALVALVGLSYWHGHKQGWSAATLECNDKLMELQEELLPSFHQLAPGGYIVVDVIIPGEYAIVQRWIGFRQGFENPILIRRIPSAMEKAQTFNVSVRPTTK